MIVFYFIVFLSICFSVHSFNTTCYNHICYEVSESKANFSVASEQCRKRNLTLAFIHNQTVQSFLTNFINSSTETIYIGLKYIDKQRFIWDCKSDRVPNLYWDTGNIKISSLESCVYFKGNVTNLDKCQEERRFICSNTSHSDPPIDPTRLIPGHCPPDFFRFLNKCYSMNMKCSDISRNWTTAQQYCHSLVPNSHLVIIDSLIEQEFVTALVTQSPHALWTGLVHAQVSNDFSIWIDARSAAPSAERRLPRYDINFKINEPNNVAQERCLMIYHRLSDIGKINDENCTTKMNHLCEAPLIQGSNDSTDQPSPLFHQGKCEKNFFEFNETCFSVKSQDSSYKETTRICDGKVLFVNGYIDVAFVRSLMAYQGKSNGWISVFDKDKPNSGATWLLHETDDIELLDPNSCYYLSSHLKGLHKAKSCNDYYAPICYYFLESHEHNNNELVCPLHWIKVGTKCFQTKIQHFDFTRSISQCRVYNAKLATLTNMKEVQAVSAMSNFDSWIGLTGEFYLNDTWMDGSAMDYCLFRHDKDQKKIIKANPKSFCFILRHSKSEWVAKNCADTNVFTCEMKAEKNRCPPKLPINVDGDCYGAFENPMTWEQAEKYCRDLSKLNTHLVSFHTISQEITFLNEINSTKYYWMGMRFTEGRGKWVDGTPINYKRNYLRFTTDFIYGRSCVTTAKPADQSNFWWKNENCGLKKPFICKMSRKKFIPSVEYKRISPSYYCPRGFTKHHLYCYKFFNESLTWNDADKACQTLFKNPLPVARLARFDSLRQFESVLSSLQDLNNIIAWIGLYQDKDYKEFVWVDEKPLEILKFVHETNNSWSNGNRVGVEISKNPYRNGRWWKREGAQNLPFLCRVDPHEMFLGPKDSSTVESYNSINEGKCPSTFVAYNGHCYYYNRDKLQFDDARMTCGKLGATLLVVNDTFEENFVRSVMRDNNEDFIWMGFRVYANNALKNWQTIDNLPVYYTHWNKLKIYTYADESLQNKIVGCYALQLTEDFNMVNGMSQISCLTTIASICKLPINPSDKKSQSIRCATSHNGTSYFLNVTHSKTGASCVRWDLVHRTDPIAYHMDTRLTSSVPFNEDGYLSYSLQRCSEINMRYTNRNSYEYRCYILRQNKFHLEDCEMVGCHASSSQTQERQGSVGHPFLILISVVTILFGLVFLVFVFRGHWLANYRVREFLARVLGRYQPDWLRYPSQSRSQPGGGSGVVGGTGFVNPVYTPLESRY